MSTVSHKSEYSIYPGHYVPVVSEKEISEEIERTKRNDIVMPSVNISDSNGSYKIEITLPGVSRENFLVYADRNVLSVYVVHLDQKADDSKKFRLHEFSCNCFERHIELPVDADTEFVSAEYREDVLRIYVPKATEHSIVEHTRIVVY